MIWYKYVCFQRRPLRLTEECGAPQRNKERFIQPTVWALLNRLVSICPFIFLGEVLTVKKVGIIMGSDSDLPVVQKAVDTLKALEIPCEAHIYSAHRSPDQAKAFACAARAEGFGVLIAAAGMAAHLAGAIAANTTLPVIGIPCKGPVLDGMDALLSTVQMPSGIPVATVAINGGVNAALLAAQILAVEDEALAGKLDQKRIADREAVLKKDAAVMSALHL